MFAIVSHTYIPQNAQTYWASYMIWCRRLATLVITSRRDLGPVGLCQPGRLRLHLGPGLSGETLARRLH